MAQTASVHPRSRVHHGRISAIVFALSLLLTPMMRGQTYQELHRLSRAEGYHPHAGLTIDAGGKLYGTTFQGGSADRGTVFRLSRAGNGWVFNVLYSFEGVDAGDGANPAARVVFGPDGALYGTTSRGGDPACSNPLGCGTVFRLQPPPTTCRTAVCPWKETIIHVFEGISHDFDGRIPVGDLAFDPAGNIYGITQNGGQYDKGMAYKLTKSGGTWTASNIHSFTTIVGLPYSGATMGADGNVYGTVFDVNHFFGGVYRLVPSGGDWIEEDLYKFNTSDGAFPFAGITLDSAGNVYGATTTYGPNNGGTAFQLSPSGGGWSYSILYGFTGMCCSYPGPKASMVFGEDGSLYGTTFGDGQFQLGSVFKLTPASGGWTYTSLYDFNDAGVAANPISNVVFDSNGHLYGTTSQGGTPAFCDGGCGVIWEITP